MVPPLTEAALSAGFSVLFKNLLGAALKKTSESISPVLDNFTTDFEPHLKANFERCSKVKTLINKAEPVDLLSIYENTSFSCGDKRIDDFDLIDAIPQVKRIAITGTGGGGKTVFMKYLWLSLFVRGDGRIPVFIELRRLNEMTAAELRSYAFRTIVEVKSKITEKQFENALNGGLFTFIFDGFDEVSREKKEEVETQILELAHKNPETIIIVSGRPDERFNAWQAFTIYEVRPLDEKQAVSLINKIDYDKKTKKRFTEQIKKGLFKKHPTFLSNPLLATMMLLTYDELAEIPEKEFLFYDQAFDILFSRHDATKEGFKRNRYVPLTIDVFKRYFSYFCLFSYFEEKFEFSEEEIIKQLKKVFSLNNANVDPQDFMRDLIESVCVMQRNGLDIQFTHRSFQEYFAAFCLANFTEDRMVEILWRMLGRPSDTVIPMLFEMRRERVERDFIIPKLDEILRLCAEHRADVQADAHQKIFGYRAILNRSNKRYQIILVPGNTSYHFVRLLRSLYADDFAERDAGYRSQDNRVAPQIIKHRKNNESSKKALDAQASISLTPDEITLTGFWQYCAAELEVAEKVLKRAIERTKYTQRGIDEIFGLNS